MLFYFTLRLIDWWFFTAIFFFFRGTFSFFFFVRPTIWFFLYYGGLFFSIVALLLNLGLSGCFGLFLDVDNEVVRGVHFIKDVGGGFCYSLSWWWSLCLFGRIFFLLRWWMAGVDALGLFMLGLLWVAKPTVSLASFVYQLNAFAPD